MSLSYLNFAFNSQGEVICDYEVTLFGNSSKGSQCMGNTYSKTINHLKKFLANIEDTEITLTNLKSKRTLIPLGEQGLKDLESALKYEFKDKKFILN